MLVGLLETNFTALPPSTCPAILRFSAPLPSLLPQYHDALFSYSRGHLSSYFTLSNFILSASFSSSLTRWALLSHHQCPPKLILVLNPHSLLPAASQPTVLTPPSIFYLISNHQTPSHFSINRNTFVTFLTSTCQLPTGLSFWVTVVSQSADTTPLCGQKPFPLKGCIFNSPFWQKVAECQGPRITFKLV